jgi:hypothetical protein
MHPTPIARGHRLTCNVEALKRWPAAKCEPQEEGSICCCTITTFLPNPTLLLLPWPCCIDCSSTACRTRAVRFLRFRDCCGCTTLISYCCWLELLQPVVWACCVWMKQQLAVECALRHMQRIELQQRGAQRAISMQGVRGMPYCPV